MSALSPPAGISSPKSGDGRGGLHPPEVGGGGGGDHQGGDRFPDYHKHLKRARLGLICGLVSVTMLFVTATAIFFARQASVVIDPHTHTYVHEWPPVQLPVMLLVWNTVILLISSITMELAHRSVMDEMVLAPVRAIVGDTGERYLRLPWLGITAFLGCAFLTGQWMAWQQFRANGFGVSTAGASPFFYVLTGAHAAHLTVGILVLLYAVTMSLMRKPVERRRIVVEVTRWYWHFMAALWIYVFLLLQYGR